MRSARPPASRLFRRRGKPQSESSNVAAFSPICPKCDKPMEVGHVPDMSHGQVLNTTWQPGAPETRRFIGGIKWKRNDQVPVEAYRCPKCGYLELYARFRES